jgi:Ca2+-binding RTX toxin-like protein
MGRGDDLIADARGDDSPLLGTSPLRTASRVDLAAGTAVTSAGADTLRSIRGAAGNDSLYFGFGVDSLDGGDGTGECFFGETVINCEET